MIETERNSYEHEVNISHNQTYVVGEWDWPTEFIGML